MQDNATKLQEKKVQQLREDLQARCFEVPDLEKVKKTAMYLSMLYQTLPLMQSHSEKQHLIRKTCFYVRWRVIH